MKKIFLYLLLLFPLIVFANPTPNGNNNAVKYVVDNRHEPTSDDFQNLLSTPITGHFLCRVGFMPVATNIPQYSLGQNHFCGKLYSEEQGIRRPVPLSNEFLFKLDLDHGTYSCSYTIKDTGKVIVSNNTIKNWDLVVGNHARQLQNANTMLDGNYYPSSAQSQLQRINNGRHVADLDIMQKAQELGIVSLDGTYSNTNHVTLSKFVNNLITLNGDYVQGVDSRGRIKINPQIEAEFSTINKKSDQNGFFRTLWLSIRELFSDGANQQRRSVMLQEYESLSQIEYFDKKLFGLYYNFMNIAWGNIFNYAGTLFLAFLALYLGGNVGLKYGLHKLKHEDEQGGFEFPMKARLLSVAMTLMLSFVQFPTGEGSQIGDQENQSTLYAQTSIAKKMISYLGNMGATVADYSSGAIEAVYMQYLLNANSSYGLKEINAFEKEQRRAILRQKLKFQFFHTACKKEYLPSYNRYGNFSGVSGKLENPEWTATIPSSWYSQESRTFFEGTAEENEKNSARVSLALCSNLEKELIMSNEKMMSDKKELSDSLTNMQTYLRSGTANLGKIFAYSQLVATKNMGWFSIASIPVLQVYLENTDLINTAEKMKNSRDGYSSLTEKNLHDMDSELQKNKDDKGLQTYTSKMEKETMGTSNML